MNPADLTWDPAAEQSVLGSILLSPACLPTVERSLRPADFRLASDRAVYEAVLSLERAGGSVDPVTVLDQTAKMGAPVSREYLFGLMELAATAAILICLVRLVQRIVRAMHRKQAGFAAWVLHVGTAAVWIYAGVCALWGTQYYAPSFAAQAKAVDLPEPLSPTIAVMLPSRTSADTPSSALIWRKCFVISFTDSMISDIAASHFCFVCKCGAYLSTLSSIV